MHNANQGLCQSKDHSKFKCKWKMDFVGDSCKIFSRTCERIQCVNNGTCDDTKDSFKCLCHPLFYGEKCQFKKDICQNITCSNNGYCYENFLNSNVWMFSHISKTWLWRNEHSTKNNVNSNKNVNNNCKFDCYYILCFVFINGFLKKILQNKKNSKNATKLKEKKLSFIIYKNNYTVNAWIVIHHFLKTCTLLMCEVP